MGCCCYVDYRSSSGRLLKLWSLIADLEGESPLKKYYVDYQSPSGRLLKLWSLIIDLDRESLCEAQSYWELGIREVHPK